MRRGFCLAALLVLSAWPALADDKKDPPKDVDKKEGDRLVTVGNLGGVLTRNDGSEAAWTVHATIRTVQPNVQAQAALPQKQQEFLRRQADAMRTRNPLQRQQQMVQLMRDVQQAQMNLFTVKDVPVDVSVVPADDVKVRLLQPPDAFDDKGNIKRYTAKELKELKGPENLVGYTGTLDDVKSNQVVLVTLARKLKAAAKDDDKPKDGDKPKDKDKPLGDKDNPLVIRMIVVVGDKK